MNLFRNYGYNAILNSQALAGFNSLSGSAAQDMALRYALVSHSRQLIITNSAAAAAIDRYVQGVVGKGIVFSPSESSDLVSAELYPMIAQRVKRAFTFAGKTHQLDTSKNLTFEQMQTLAMESMTSSGEVFFIRRPDETSWAAIEADRVMTPYYLADTSCVWHSGVQKIVNNETGNVIIDGIEIDDDQREVAVWVLKEYLEKPLTMSADDIVRVPMVDDATGLPLVIHLYRQTRPSQFRGVPLLAPVIEQLFLQSAYIQAEGQAAALQASLYGFMTSDNATNDITATDLPSRLDERVPVAVDKDDDGETPDETPDFNVIYNGSAEADSVANGLYHPYGTPISSGRFMHLRPGEDIKFLQSTHPNSNFAAYMSATTELIAAAVGLPAEVLKLSFNSSYSASRAALLQAEAKYTQVRTFFIEKFMKPVIECFAYNEALRDFDEEAAAYVAKAITVEAEFQQPHMPSIDPEAELKSWQLGIELGLTTRDEAAQAVYGHNAIGTPAAND